MQDLAEGWIVFERADGQEKRRLSPYPDDWQSRSDAEVASLCESAEIVKKRLTPPLGSWKVGDEPVGPHHADDAEPSQARHRDNPPSPAGHDDGKRPFRR